MESIFAMVVSDSQIDSEDQDFGIREEIEIAISENRYRRMIRTANKLKNPEAIVRSALEVSGAFVLGHVTLGAMYNPVLMLGALIAMDDLKKISENQKDFVSKMKDPNSRISKDVSELVRKVNGIQRSDNMSKEEWEDYRTSLKLIRAHLKGSLTGVRVV